MARRHRSIRSIRELRAEAEAAQALGRDAEARPGPSSERPTPRAPSALRPKPVSQPRSRVVWAVCDVGGRPVATFPYPQKAEAEAHAAGLKARGKGSFFVRSIKEPILPD